MGFLTENLGWKFLSLIVAVGMWIAFVANEELTMPIPTVVQFRNSPDNLVLSSELPDRVVLEVRGTSTRLRQFAETPTPVILDLAKVPSGGERTYHIDSVTARMPAGLELLRAIPSRIRVQVEPLATREVPVRVRTTGRPREGWKLAALETVPKFVRIVGPSSHVGRTEAVETDLVDLTGLNSYRELRMSVYVSSPLVQLEPQTDVLVKVFLEPDDRRGAEAQTR